MYQKMQELLVEYSRVGADWPAQIEPHPHSFPAPERRKKDLRRDEQG